MNLISWILILFSILFIRILHTTTTTLRCYDDLHNKTVQLIENCRACAIYIESKTNTSGISSKKGLDENDLSIQDFALYDKTKRRYRRWSADIIIHQKCAREFDGPIYGFDQTHCYCNSNLCNTNIQRCIYEIASKRYFSCYHGTNSSGPNSLEISKKCRSCRIEKQSNSNFYYQCLTFGEQEQQSETHCTCQHPMCNQDFTVCQRFQQISSQPRLNIFPNSTEFPQTTMNMNSTKSINSAVLITNQTVLENSTLSINTTPFVSNETILIELKNQANTFPTKSFFFFYVIIYLNI